MNSGIYYIKNIVNDKIYIGSTIDFKSRFRDHKRELRTNTHKNKFLQGDYNLYGADSFEFDTLEFYEPALIVGMEQYWMNLTSATNRDYGYNIKTKAQNLYDFSKGKPVEQYTTDGKLVKVWESRNEAVRQYSCGVIVALNMKNKSSNGFLWRYSDSVYSVDYIVNRNKSKKWETSKPTPIYQYDLDGNFIKEWRCSNDIERFYNISFHRSEMTVDKRIRLSSQWRDYKQDKIDSYTDFRVKQKRIVLQFDKDWNFIQEFESITEAENKTGIHRTTIIDWCNGKRIKTNKFKWQFKTT